jgi:transposase
MSSMKSLQALKGNRNEAKTRMQRRYGLRDDQWERINALLPGQQGQPGATARDNRLFVEAVLYRYRAGMPWRDLPPRFGDFRGVHLRHSRWSKTGVWERVFKVLAQQADNEYVMIDSTIVRAHQHSAGAQKRGLQKTKIKPSGAAEGD